jgi:uncharacterized protein YtpQ (UPF0354 family)
MSFWPFGSEKNVVQPDAEPSTLDRLTTRTCKRDEFFLLYSKLLQERMPDCSIEFSSESVLRLVRANGEESTAYLDNLWLKYSQDFEDRTELLEKYVRMYQDLWREDLLLDKQNIIAMIKDTEYLEQFPERADFVTEHLCGDLWIVYAEDGPESITTVKRESMMQAGVDETGLRNLAVENLKRILPAAECHGRGPWYLLTAGSDYVASLLLFDSIWEQIADMVPGKIVATVPTRDVLMFTGSESKEGLSGIRAKSQELCHTGPYSISQSLIVRDAGKWAIFNLV